MNNYIKAKPAILILTLLTALLMVLPSGCAINGQADQESVTINLWHYYKGPQQDAFNALVQMYNETEGLKSGITVEPRSFGNVGQLTEAVLDAAKQTAGAYPVPNIFAAYSDTALEVDRLGLVAPLDDYITEEELSRYIAGYIDEGRFDAEDNLKIFPIAKSTELFMLNETDWKTFANATGASIDDLATVEGVTATARRYYEWTDSLTPEPDDGKAFFGRDAMANYMLIGSMQLGHEMFAAAGGVCTLNIDPTAMRKLWDNFYVPYISGHYVHYGQFRSDDVKTGDIIALVGATTGVPYFPTQIQNDDNSEREINLRLLGVPLFEGGRAYAVQQGAGMVVTRADKRTEQACVDFLKWFTQDSNNMYYAVASGYIPVTVKASTTEALNDFIANNPDVVISERMRMTLEQAFSISQTHHMYTPKAFDGGAQARTILENSLMDKARMDRQTVDDAVAAGIPRSQALEQFSTDANFESWLKDITAQLSAVVSHGDN